MASGYDILDRQFTSTAEIFALAALAISTTCICVFMAALQFMLLKVQGWKKGPKSPRPLEIYIVVTLLWSLYKIFDGAIHAVALLSVSVLLSTDDKREYRELQATEYHLGYWLEGSDNSKSWDGLRLLFFQVLATWLLSQGITLVFYTIIPLLCAVRRNPQRVVLKLHRRSLELLDFVKEINRKPLVIPCNRSDSLTGDGSPRSGRETTHVINFRRHQTHDPSEERTLNWDLTIDKSALDEMKETLGPPGGFGELGFNVASDRVFFGAMGVKTRYVAFRRILPLWKIDY